MFTPFRRHCQIRGSWVRLAIWSEKTALEPEGALVMGTAGTAITGGERTCLAAENSEVLLAGSGGVAVVNGVNRGFVGKVTEKALLPLPSVVTEAAPR